MPPAACFRPYSRDFARAGIFARSARSSAQSVSDIVSAGYRLLLAFLM